MFLSKKYCIYRFLPYNLSIEIIHYSLHSLASLHYAIIACIAKEAYKITERWQQYLKKQRARLANSRKIKRKEQIEKLMKFIDAKLSQTPNLKTHKLQLTKCELCS